MFNKNIITEYWTRWQPIENLAKKYDLMHYEDKKQEGFKLILNEENKSDKKIQILFEKSIHLFRVTYETYREKTYYDMNEKYGVIFYLEWTFFKVYNSKCLKWLNSESSTPVNDKQFIHYCIITSELMIDIVAKNDNEPKMKYLD